MFEASGRANPCVLYIVTPKYIGTQNNLYKRDLKVKAARDSRK
jgi:hypothetical protein